MNNFWTTVGHTAGRRIKSKAFMFATLTMMILIIALMNLNNILDNFSGGGSGEAQIIAVIDNTTSEGAFAESLVSHEDGSFQYTHFSNGDLNAAIEDANDGEFDFVLALTGGYEAITAEFYGDSNDFTVAMEVNSDVQRVKESLVTGELNLNEQQLAMIYSPVSFNENPLSENGGIQTQESHMQAYWMVYGLVFAIYMIVITFGTMIATEVATEKSSRVMELIVSSVNPVTQMVGKILGIGAAGMVNLLAIIAAGFIGYSISGDNFLQTFFTETFEITLIIFALALIILGYFLYGGVAAMLGALVSRAEEVNQAIQPLIFLAVIALFISIFGLNAPDEPFIQVLSYVPFFTPQLLFLRIGMSTVPVWEIVLIFAILIGSAILINILAARIYKGGVLMYGKFSWKSGIKQAFNLGKKES